ncbi:MAG: hypothetical protein AB1782_08215 [Cyanobacteriota bacterium]
MTLQTCGLSRRQLETMYKTTYEKMKFEIIREYGNALILQGRARDVGSLSDVERDMEAMCDAYAKSLMNITSRVIEANNKKLLEDFESMKKSP